MKNKISATNNAKTDMKLNGIIIKINPKALLSGDD